VLRLYTYDEQVKIENSGIREIFTPGAPAVNKVQFSGRERELGNILSCLLRPGEHSLIFGDRGVGKTSLARNAARQYTSIKRANVYLHSCSSEDDFLKIIRPLLVESDIDPRAISLVKRKGGAGGAKISAAFAKANIESERYEETTLDQSIEKLSLNEIAGCISEKSSLLIIDEFDTIESKAVIKNIAEFIKLLSDKNSSTKLIIVGVAKTSSDLLRGHYSIGRSLKETKLDRMSDVEIIDIVASGADKAKLVFSTIAMNTITSISNGFPFFCHLIALYCSEYAIAKNLRSIDQALLMNSLKTIAIDARATLEREFNDISLSYKTDLFKWLLIACSKYGFVEFNKDQLRQSLDSMCVDYNESSLTNAIGKLCKENVFSRVKRGYYKFSDPRMPSFIKLEFHELTKDASNKPYRLGRSFE
jgi:AAA+ ATPase superfamily predicted ATPase